MTKLDSDFWDGNRPAQPSNGGEVGTSIEPAQPVSPWRPEGGQVQPQPGGFPGAAGLPEGQR
jgi:hypothetical protein